MKIVMLMFLSLFVVSCKTNMVSHYDCSGKEEIVSSTFEKCIIASKEEDKPGVQSIKQNPIHACKENTQELLCSPVFKEIL